MMGSVSEARRHNLYNGLVHLLGPDQADTLMSYLPTEPIQALATKRDLDAAEKRLTVRIDGFEERMHGFGQRMDGFGQRMDGFEQRMDRFDQRMDRFDDRLAGIDRRLDVVNERLDRLFLTMLAGMVGMIGTAAAAFFFA
jgi:hypothetical protein